MSHVYTIRGQIRGIAQRWQRQYPHDKRDILAKLGALDVDTATPADVAAIIGNSSWTDLRCDECGQSDLLAVVEIGQPPDYESATAVICQSCLEAALIALKSAASDDTETP